MANQQYVNYTLIISYNINVYCLKSKKINKREKFYEILKYTC